MCSSLKQENIDTIADRYGVNLFVYFGSYQTSFYHKESDIDIAFLCGGMLDHSLKMKLLRDLMIYHRKSEIDLIDLKTAAPLLRYEIAKNGKILYEREPGLFERHRLYYIKRYYELKPVMKEEMKNIGKSILEMINDV